MPALTPGIQGFERWKETSTATARNAALCDHEEREGLGIGKGGVEFRRCTGCGAVIVSQGGWIWIVAAT